MKNRFWIPGALEIVFDADKLSPREWDRLADLAAFMERSRNSGDPPAERMFFRGSARQLGRLESEPAEPGPGFLRRLALEADKNIGRILLAEATD